MRDFPDGFLFGSSTAAHQVEGGNVNNDWWAWEHAPYTSCVESSGDAIDQWHRYAEDFALLAELGQNAHRLSLEWSRIEPAPGEFSARGARALPARARDARAARADRVRDAAPLHAAALAGRAGGWLAPDAVERFARYTERVAAALGDLMPFAGTINEPQIVACMGYRAGLLPARPAQPGHCPAGHAAADRRPRGRGRGGQDAAAATRRPASACSCPPSSPRVPTTRPASRRAPSCARDDGGRLPRGSRGRLGRRAVLHAPARRPGRADGFAPAPEGAPLTLMGWELHPEGLHRAITSAARHRPARLRHRERDRHRRRRAARRATCATHLAQVARALPTASTCAASSTGAAFDNFEWAEGYRPTFGLIGIDREDGLRRVVRPSAHAYGELARTDRSRI